MFAEGSRCLSHLLHANCMARSVSACLSWRDTTFFGQHRTSALQLKSSHHKIFESHATGCAGDTGTCTWVAIVGPTSPWVFEPSTTTQVDHDSTLSADADGQQLHLIP